MELFSFFGVILILVFLLEKFLRQLKIGKFETRYVLVTGCDTGFGYLTVKKLDKMNFKVFACCLTKDSVKKFEEMGSSNIMALEMDVSNDASIEKAMEIVKRHLPVNTGLWAVVNNAGILGTIGSINLHTRQDYERTLAVNLYGVIMVTKACMPLVKKEKGRIINTSSVLGRVAMLTVSYCISKYGVEAFSDTLRRENYSTGVKVSIVEPGVFKTNIVARDSILRTVDAQLSNMPADMKSQLPANARELLSESTNLFVQGASPDIHLVVNAYVHAITATYPKKRYLVGFDAKYIFRSLSMVPEWLSDLYINWNVPQTL